jgi:glycosyltransferase involved in cell wall biosynthesis
VSLFPPELACQRVSVVIPAYRAAAFVGRAVDSVLAQQPPPAEVIVVDDDSPDDLRAALAQHVLAGRVRLVRLPHNQGVAAARNAGVRAADGDVVAFLDADDVWLPEHLSRALSVLADHPDVDVVLQDFDIVDLQTQQRHGSWFALRHEALSRLRTTALDPVTRRVEGGFVGALMSGCFVHMQATVVRRAVFERTMFDERLRCSEDVDWALRSVHLGGATWAVRAQASGVYHRHAQSLTADLTQNHERIERTGLMLFAEYLAWPRLAASDRMQIRRALVRACLDLSYFARSQHRVADAWRFWAIGLHHGLHHGLGLQQAREGAKLLLSTPWMLLQRLSRRRQR